MRFKIDENLPVEVGELLRQHEHDTITVKEEGMGGGADLQLTHVCQKEGRALVTLDLDFADITAYPPEDYQGIIVFRPAVQSIRTLVRLTTRILSLLREEPLLGHLWIVEDHQVRIRQGSQGQTRVT
jgi:predicted nuclease of predicted toxin-antitoxin system